MKLVALYAAPDDPKAFDQAYFDTHLPLLRQVPGLQQTTITRFSRSLMGEALHMMAVMEFGDWDSLKAGLNSEEMQAAADNLQTFAAGLVTLQVGEDESQD